MTKQDFLNAYTALDINVQSGYSHKGISLETERERDYLEVRWLTGGMSGGSCWGDNADCPVDSEPECEFGDLDKLLEIVAPRMTFLVYKRMHREIVKYNSYDDQEYYGNYYVYATKRVYLDDLYEWLKNNNLLETA